MQCVHERKSRDKRIRLSGLQGCYILLTPTFRKCIEDMKLSLFTCTELKTETEHALGEKCDVFSAACNVLHARRRYTKLETGTCKIEGSLQTCMERREPHYDLLRIAYSFHQEVNKFSPWSFLVIVSILIEWRNPVLMQFISVLLSKRSRMIPEKWLEKIAIFRSLNCCSRLLAVGDG